MKKRSFVVFAATLIIGVVIVFSYFSLTTPKIDKAIKVSPILLDVTNENGGKRCENRRYEDSSESPFCYNLQEKLITASGNGNFEEIREALRLGANVNATYYTSYAALDSAAMRGQKDAVILLIENGADVNKTEKWDETPLTRAVYYNQKEIVEILLENNADICHVTHHVGENPRALTIAKREGHAEVVSLLKEHGANWCFVRSFFK